MYVIAGATGHVGSVVARELCAKPVPVRVLVRDADKGRSFAEQGAEVGVGTLEDPAFLARALAGATGAFLLLPPNLATDDFPAYQRRVADVVSGAVRAAKVPHVVVLSSIGADRESGLGAIAGLNYFERQLGETGTRLTVLRPGFFMENVAMSLAAAREQGIYPSFMPESVAMPMIATRDIAAEAVRVLLEPPARSLVIDILGPAYTAAEVASLLGERLRKSVSVAPIPPERWHGALVAAGLSAHFADLYVEMYTGFGQGLASPKGDRLVQGTTELRDVIAALTA